MEENINLQTKEATQPTTIPSPSPIQARSNKVPLIVMTTVTILALIFAGYFGYQNFQSNKESEPIETSSLMTIPKTSLECGFSTSQQAYLNGLEIDLKRSLYTNNGTFFYDFRKLSNGLEQYMRIYNFRYNDEDFKVQLLVFRNFKGVKEETGYEGFTGIIRDYDSEKDLFLSLEEGEHQARVWYEIDYTDTIVTVKNLGKNKFLIYDTVFSPSSTVNRVFMTYDETIDNLIYVTVFSDEAIHDTETEINNGIQKVISYPDNFQNFINDIEQFIVEAETHYSIQFKK